MDVYELEGYINSFLEVTRFDDYAPNGLQVEGCREVKKLVTGVTACRALIEEAIENDADAILVHHGYFWRGEDARIVGMKAQRLKLLMQNEISMLAYHLPLDAHPTLGNNAQLAARLGLAIGGSFGDGKVPLAIFGNLPEPMTLREFTDHLASCVGREPLVIDGGDDVVRSIGLCTGAAQNYLAGAVALGLDAFVTGEISESTVHIARECEVNFFAAGHHATEKFGVNALGEYLAEKFDLEHLHIDVDNPV